MHAACADRFQSQRATPDAAGDHPPRETRFKPAPPLSSPVRHAGVSVSLEESHAMGPLCADTTDREQHVIGRKDDPAFLYFPANYRWSMGLLICLGAAPWTGIEIDEVHRVGRALEGRIGDDTAWFEEWA